MGGRVRQGARLIARFGLPGGRPGGWLRLLPVGTFARFGRTVRVTPAMVREMAAHFGRVPETGVPVTVAHNDAAGKVGDVVEVDARPDGLWGRIRWSATGARLLAEGAFRYLSPEVIWGPVDYDGRVVRNVLAGVSLVNQPFFGRRVSLFCLRGARAGATGGGNQYREGFMQEMMQTRQGVVDRFLARLAGRLLARLVMWLLPGAAEAQTRLDELEAAEAEHALAARFGALQGDGLGRDGVDRLVQVARFDAALADELAGQFRALLAQNAQAALFEEIGASGAEAVGPVERFNAAVKESMHACGLDYAAAGQKVAAEQPELYRAYQSAVTNKL